jgi:hypothetical protein
MVQRDRHGLRFAVPVLLVLAFAVSWGEWLPRLGEAFSPLSAGPAPVTARVDAWIDPPPYTGQAPVFLSRLTGETLTEPVSVPEGSKLTVRVVSREPAQVSVQTAEADTALSPREDAPIAPEGQEAILSYEAVLDRTATVVIADSDRMAEYPVTVIDDLPPTVSRGPLEPNRNGSFNLAFEVADDTA